MASLSASQLSSLSASQLAALSNEQLQAYERSAGVGVLGLAVGPPQRKPVAGALRRREHLQRLIVLPSLQAGLGLGPEPVQPLRVTAATPGHRSRQ